MARDAELRCPVCRSGRVVLVLGIRRRAFCSVCGAHWVQDGSPPREIVPGSPSSSLARSGSTTGG